MLQSIGTMKYEGHEKQKEAFDWPVPGLADVHQVQIKCLVQNTFDLESYAKAKNIPLTLRACQ